MKPPRRIKIDGRLYSTEVAEMMYEREMHNAYAPVRDVIRPEWDRMVYEILDDMQHPLRDNASFVNSFAKRLAKKRVERA